MPSRKSKKRGGGKGKGGGSGGGGKGKGGRGRQQQQQQQTGGQPGSGGGGGGGGRAAEAAFCRAFGFVRDSAPGCHVSHFGEHSPWVLETAPIEWEDFGLPGPPPSSDDDDVSGNDDNGCEPTAASLPDISVDPDSHVLTVINAHASSVRVFYITLFHRTLGRQRQALAEGVAVGDDGKAQRCTTFVLRLRPHTYMDVCYVLGVRVDSSTGMPRVHLESDISTLPLCAADGSCGAGGSGDSGSRAGRTASAPPREPPPPAAATGSSGDAGVAPPAPVAVQQQAKVYRFPFATGAPGVLCSQGCGGHFTHFYPATQFAVDLECPVGTPLLALADGVVTEVRQDSRVSGISVSNLYKWNSITLRLADGAVAEYVHILHDSAAVSVGDAVVAGQPLCRSGQAGFCPTPHLHLQVHDSPAADAPTVPFCFRPPAPPDDVVGGGATQESGGGGGSGGGGDRRRPAAARATTAAFQVSAGRWYTAAGEVAAPATLVDAARLKQQQRQYAAAAGTGESVP